ncbi:MAG: serine/threonine protein kinase [Acidobacteria bacterium]|nr:serine/threonine protein kinase [Acidobacteriota bacterium]
MFRPTEKIGPYTLVKQLGRGAFGVVWLAERRGAIVTTQVALKITLDETPNLDALRQEAELWVKAGGHPNVLSIIEAEVYDGQVVIVSEYVSGGSLSDWLKGNGDSTPSIESSINMMIGLLSGLKHLHARQIIHRDIKPANILLQTDIPKLADFGISRVVNTTNHSGGIAGTPTYMAPEAFNGERNQQTDIWSMGVMFYQMLAGKVPFSKPDIPSLCVMIHRDEPPPLPNTIPSPLKKIVLNALEKDTNRRYKSAEEMLNALQKAYLTIGEQATITNTTQNTNSANTLGAIIAESKQVSNAYLSQKPSKQANNTSSTSNSINSNTVSCPSCYQTNSYDPTTNFCQNCSTNFAANNPSTVRKSSGGTQQVYAKESYLDQGAGVESRPGHTMYQPMYQQNAINNADTPYYQIEEYNKPNSFWYAFYDGLARHTGSSSLTEISAKVVFIGSLAYFFVIASLEYTLWDAIFVTCWSSFYAAAFALFAALITKVIVMVVEGSQWVKENKRN